MARILLLTTKEKGHLNPMMGVAKWLRRRDHEVGWCCLPFAPDYLAEMGIEPVPFAGGGDGGDEDLPTGGPELAELVRDEERLYDWIHTLLIDGVEDRIAPMRETLRDWEPDVLATDPMLYHGIIAAEYEEIPYACISSSLNPVTPEGIECAHARNMERLADERRELFERHGLSPSFRVADCLSPHLNIVFTIREYIGEDIDVPPETHLVGPSITPGERGDEVDFPWGALDDRPTIYASFGSQISHQPDIFERIARATDGLEAQVVISCGDLAETNWPDSLPDHVVPVRYAPQRELLDRVELMITHGGANSVMEALTAGVPLLISPVCNDQPMQAYFIRRRGVGREVDLAEADDEEARTAIRHLLDDKAPERRAVEEVAAAYRETDGARWTAELIEGLIP